MGRRFVYIPPHQPHRVSPPLRHNTCQSVLKWALRGYTCLLMCCVVVPNLLWSCLQSVEMVISRSLHEHGDENYCFIGSWLSLLRGRGTGGAGGDGEKGTLCRLPLSGWDPLIIHRLQRRTHQSINRQVEPKPSASQCDLTNPQIIRGCGGGFSI